MLSASADTPAHRALVSELSIPEIEKLVDEMRERRMRAQNAFQIAQEAKAKIKLEKDKARYEHLLQMFDKKLVAVDKSLEVLGKYLNELKVLELVCGD